MEVFGPHKDTPCVEHSEKTSHQDPGNRRDVCIAVDYHPQRSNLLGKMTTYFLENDLLGCLEK
jgi:hypothetical protein